MRRLVVLCLALVALCTACKVQSDVVLTMKDDGSGSVTVTFTADAEAASALKTFSVTDAASAGWTVTGPTDVVGGGSKIVLAKDFTNSADAQRVLQELSGPAGPLHDVKVTEAKGPAEQDFTIDGTARLDGGPDGLGDAELWSGLAGATLGQQLQAAGATLPGVLQVSLTLDLPGSVSAVGAKAGGGKAVLTVPLDGSSAAFSVKGTITDKVAKSARRLEGIFGWLMSVYGILLALAFVAWIVALRQRQRRRLARLHQMSRPVRR